MACIRSLFLISDLFDGIFITLDKSKLGFRVKVIDPSWEIWGAMMDEEREGLVREPSKSLKQVEWVEGVRRFKMKDTHALRRALEAA